MKSPNMIKEVKLMLFSGGHASIHQNINGKKTHRSYNPTVDVKNFLSKQNAIILDYNFDRSLMLSSDQLEIMAAFSHIISNFSLYLDLKDFNDFGVFCGSMIEDNAYSINIERNRPYFDNLRNLVKTIKNIDESSFEAPYVKMIKLPDNNRAFTFDDSYEYLVPECINDLYKNIISTQEILRSKGLKFTKDNIAVKVPQYKYSIPLSNIPEGIFFGLNATGFELAYTQITDPNSRLNKLHREMYYKYTSKYHNCAGFVRLCLENMGANGFINANCLNTTKLKVLHPFSDYTSTESLGRYATRLKKNIDEINITSKFVFRHISDINDTLNNYKKEKKYRLTSYLSELNNKSLSGGMINLLRSYNNLPSYLFLDKKTELLILIIKKLKEDNCSDITVLSCVLAEIDRHFNYLYYKEDSIIVNKDEVKKFTTTFIRQNYIDKNFGIFSRKTNVSFFNSLIIALNEATSYMNIIGILSLPLCAIYNQTLQKDLLNQRFTFTHNQPMISLESMSKKVPYKTGLVSRSFVNTRLFFSLKKNCRARDILEELRLIIMKNMD